MLGVVEASRQQKRSGPSHRKHDVGDGPDQATRQAGPSLGAELLPEPLVETAHRVLLRAARPDVLGPGESLRQESIQLGALLAGDLPQRRGQRLDSTENHGSHTGEARQEQPDSPVDAPQDHEDAGEQQQVSRYLDHELREEVSQ